MDEHDPARLAKLREQMLRAPGGEHEREVPETILASWRRSLVCGVSVTWTDLPYNPDLDLDSRLMRAAAPVLDRLERELAGTPVSVVLTDGDGVVLDRRAGDKSLGARLDAVSLATGFSYSEEHAGTNGIGTALEEGRVAQVFGHEHFAERLVGLACAGAPIRHPVRSRVEGVIDLTCRADDAGPLMRALVQEAARDIQQRLLDEIGDREHALLREFLGACRHNRLAVVTLNEDTVMMNARAGKILEATDRVVLWESATAAVRAKREMTFDVCLASGRTASIRCRPVMTAGGPVGAVIVLGESEAAPHRPAVAARPPAVLPGVVGRNPAWTRLTELLIDCARQRRWVVLEGEPGVGKLSVARAVNQFVRPPGVMRVLDARDCADAAGAGQAWADVAGDAGSLILRHVDELRPAALRELTDAIRGLDRDDDRWVVATVSATSTGPQAQREALDELLREFPARFSLPPLRSRVDDVQVLVEALLRSRSRGGLARCSPDAVRSLMRCDWPDNVRELDDVLRQALQHNRSGVIEVEDLPPAYRVSSRRRILTQLEQAEREAVIRALENASGDKNKAAAALGISRATIYRKIRDFGIAI